MNAYDYKYKIVLIGDSKVGKTSFFNRINQNITFSTTTTIGVDLCTVSRIIDDKNIRICLWDTAGQEQFQSIVRNYFREVCGAILMFDLSDYSTFKHVEHWIKLLQFENTCRHTHPIMLLGNKSDKNKNNVPSEEIENLCIEGNIIYNEISCKNDNITTLEKIFTSIVEKIYLNKYECCRGIHDCNKNTTVITNKIIKNNKWMCCI
tara:strand:- start:639 stop:1256 length:618 start_codon:yes stop_codon:yes gene_type:complete